MTADMERNLADIFEVVVDAVPEREALVAGGRRLTFAALDERANRLAAVLAGAGIGPGDQSRPISTTGRNSSRRCWRPSSSGRPW